MLNHVPILQINATNLCREAQKLLVVSESLSHSPVPAQRIKEDGWGISFRELKGQAHRYQGLTQMQEGIILILVFASGDPLPCNPIPLCVWLWKDNEASDSLCALHKRFGHSFTSAPQGEMGNKVRAILR